MQVDFEVLIIFITAIFFTIGYLMSEKLTVRMILGSINSVSWFSLALVFVAAEGSFPVFAMVFFLVGLIFTITLIHDALSMWKDKSWKRWRTDLE